MVVILLLSGCTNTSQNNNSNNNTNNNISPQKNETEIRIPISEISSTAKFYSYDSNGISIRFFAVKDKSGAVHIAFDACDVCYNAKKGYKQNGEVLQCINCGLEFSISSLGTENKAGGGCWPSYLPMKIENDTVIIEISDLKARSYMF